MATLAVLTRLLSLGSDDSAQAQKDTSQRPTLPRINTRLSGTAATSRHSSVDSGSPLTPQLLSAFPSPPSRGDAPIFTLNIPLQVASLSTDDEDMFASSDSDSEPTTPRISVISPQTPSISPNSAFGSPWVPDERDAQDYLSPVSTPPRKIHNGDAFGSPLSGFQSTSPIITTPTRRRRVAKPGPFKFLRTLNKGSYGTAYATRDLCTNKVVCTKVFGKKRMAQNREYLSGLTTEFVTYKAIASADEEQRKWLMTMHGAVQDGERVMLVLDLMKCDLFALLEDQIPRPTIRRWIAQIALGIDALHAIGIIHRDIKPENILLCPDGLNVRITDFTNAYLDAPLPDPEDDDPDAPVPSPRLQWWRKYSKHVIGTVHYLAPEVVEKKWYGLAVDYWALGCVLYDLVVGSPLFPNKSTMREYTKWVRDGHSVAEYFQQRTPILTDEELDLLSGLLCLEPDNRFRLEHLESHPYFTIDSETETTFTLVRSLPTPTISARSAHFQSSQYPPTLASSQPLCHAKPESCPSLFETDDESEKDEDKFAMFGWVNPNGIWGSGTAVLA